MVSRSFYPSAFIASSAPLPHRPPLNPLAVSAQSGIVPFTTKRRRFGEIFTLIAGYTRRRVARSYRAEIMAERLNFTVPRQSPHPH
jgi:hypothetical protein